VPVVSGTFKIAFFESLSPNHFSPIRSIRIKIERAKPSRRAFAQNFFHMINNRAEAALCRPIQIVRARYGQAEQRSTRKQSTVQKPLWNRHFCYPEKKLLAFAAYPHHSV
jgi:hypothetical protein